MNDDGAITLYTGLVRLSVYDADGFLGLQADGLGEEQSGLAPSEAWHPYGFDARPRDPDVDANGTPKAGAALLRLSEGNLERAMAVNDPRPLQRLPALGKGSTRHYADTGGSDLPYVLLRGEDGACAIHVPVDAPSILLEHAAGTKIQVSASMVDLGGTGGNPVVVDGGALAAFFAAIQTAFANLGQTVTPPTGYTATKVKAI